MKQNHLRSIEATDPEFAAFFAQFAREEVVNEPGRGLQERTRYMAGATRS